MTVDATAVPQAPSAQSITEWVFEVVTLTQDASNKKNKRQDFEGFWPIPATTPFWPAVVYTGGTDGKTTITSATVPFPTPPPSIGPDAPDTPSGSWPKRLIQPYVGFPESPMVGECAFEDFSCIFQPWFYGIGSFPGSPGGDQNYYDAMTTCPAVTSSSSSMTQTQTATISVTPEPSPYEQGNSMDNQVKCYNSRENTESVRMINADTSFCNLMESEAVNNVLGPNYFKSMNYSFPYNGGFGTVTITISWQIQPLCEFIFDMNLCMQYLSVPDNSCNCDGINGKQGGIVKNDCYTIRVDPQLSI
jgi:hypothetical protein